MSKPAEAAAAVETKPDNQQHHHDLPGDAAALVESLTKAVDQITSLDGKVTEMDAKMTELSKARYPYGPPNGGRAFGVRTGEDPLTSRPYSLMRLTKALSLRAANYGDWNSQAKVELDLSNRLRKAYYDGATWDGFGGGVCVPLGSDLMPMDDRQVEDVETGKTTVIKGMPKELVNECRQVMILGEVDMDEYAQLAKAFAHVIRKDLSANTLTSGGSLVAFASQGELIELLRAQEVFSQVGAQQLDLPPQGKIRFPKVTGGVTIAATSEGATISESTPATGELVLQAKPYTGLVDIPDELMRFATSVTVEAWLRSEFTRDLSLKTTQDMINGNGGTAIQGIINYSGFRTVVASTTGGNGDTLDPEDPLLLYADIADQDAPVDRGFFFAMTNTLWASVMTRKSSATGDFMFSHAFNAVGGGKPAMNYAGFKVVTSTQIPTNRTKGSGTTLTLLLGGVGAEYIIARAGVVELAVTNSDASKFASRISTMRGTQYLDGGPRHPEAFGMVDDLLNS